MPPVLYLEAGQLDDDELAELKNFLEADDAVEDVSVAYLGMFEESDPGELLDIQAAAAPFILSINFIHAHWREITGLAATATTGVQNTAKLTAWIRKKIVEYNASQRSKYDLIPLYDADGNVYKLVKTPKKKD